MAEHNAEPPAEGAFRARRQLLKLLSMAVGGPWVLAVAGCGQEQTKEWQRPEWFRSKQGSNGNGRGRR
jgi:hypothetical protein